MLSIQTAGLKEINLINELAYRIWPEAYKSILSSDQMKYMLNLIYSPSALKKQMEDLCHKFIIVYNDKLPAGFASYSLKINSKNIFRLHKIYILHQLQGKGIGKYLLTKIIDDVKPSGAKFLELNVNRHNKALDFYKKFGFKIMSEEDIDIENGYFMNDYVMTLKL
jgi:ribosomal protein S18 acetylase RimI-like enzyme